MVGVKLILDIYFLFRINNYQLALLLFCNCPLIKLINDFINLYLNLNIFFLNWLQVVLVYRDSALLFGNNRAVNCELEVFLKLAQTNVIRNITRVKQELRYYL